MRKPAPSLPISPKQLKQFAVATLIVTGLVAMFANGEAAQVEAQVQAREARNQLLDTEAEKLGTRRVAAGMTVKAHPVAWGGDGGEAPGDDSGGGSGSIDPDAPRTMPPSGQSATIVPPHPVLPRNMPTVPGGKVTVTGQLATELSGPVGDAARAKNKGKAGEMFRPDAQQIEAIKAVSRERTGGSSPEDF